MTSGLISVCIIQTLKGSKEHLFILTGTHSVQIVREIHFIKPQNNTWTQINGQKRWKIKQERKRLILFCFCFYTLFGAWKIVGMTILVCASFFCIEEDWRDGCRGKGAEVLKYLTGQKVEHCINWGYASSFMCKKISWQLQIQKKGSHLFLALLAFCCFETASVYLSVPAKTFKKTFKGILSENLRISF